jgi:protein tyrosine phosphatase
MIYEKEVVLIIMVCNLIEKKYPKCHKYWSPKENLTNLTLSSISETQIDSNLVEREFKLTNIKTNEVRSVKHLHFVGWPDHGVPDLNDVYKSFQYMLEKVDDAKTKSKGPIVVHCSAGVGRTGTFISMYNLHYNIRNQIPNQVVRFNIWNTVRKLKEQRRSSVENVLQYKYIYSFMAKYLLDVLK